MKPDLNIFKKEFSNIKLQPFITLRQSKAEFFTESEIFLSYFAK